MATNGSAFAMGWQQRFVSLVQMLNCKTKVENMKHKPNSKGQAGTTADACKKAENEMSSQPIANAPVGGWLMSK